MKRIVCFLLVISCVFSLCACGSSSITPFSKLADKPDEDTLIKRLGTPDDYSFYSETHYITYNDYAWNDYHGVLRVKLKGIYRKDKNNNSYYAYAVDEAKWYVPMSEEEAAVLEKKIYEIYQTKIGNRSESGRYSDDRRNSYYLPRYSTKRGNVIGSGIPESVTAPHLEFSFYSYYED